MLLDGYADYALCQTLSNIERHLSNRLLLTTVILCRVPCILEFWTDAGVSLPGMWKFTLPSVLAFGQLQSPQGLDTADTKICPRRAGRYGNLIFSWLRISSKLKISHILYLSIMRSLILICLLWIHGDHRGREGLWADTLLSRIAAKLDSLFILHRWKIGNYVRISKIFKNE